jgi:hypothetical protein
MGNPPPAGPCYVTLSYCPLSGPTVALHATREKAEQAKGLIDNLTCGGRCRGDHELVVLRAGSEK